MHTHKCIHTCTLIHAHTHTHMQTHTQMHTHTHTHAHTHTHTNTHTHTCKHTHTCTHTHIHTHTDTEVNNCFNTKPENSQQQQNKNKKLNFILVKIDQLSVDPNLMLLALHAPCVCLLSSGDLSQKNLTKDCFLLTRKLKKQRNQRVTVECRSLCCS